MIAFATLLVASTSATFGLAAHAPARSALSPLHRRDLTEQVPISCFVQPPNGAVCDCPTDLNGDNGVLINVFPGYQCAYAGGACTWGDTDGALQNIFQTNCPTVAPCPSTGCECPIDNNNDTGVLINQFTGFQCAFAGGACTWDFDGVLQNIHQTNCPTTAVKCAALSRK
ncbi:hypothetical protein PUNSTDRAFT_144300 [Punctularia strigosozonata HHB-11173 SS5]|uniref:uncharacterized protein n=1 Tax=Punctularia strigosozonata (strain HHB-11173) TaxID=741275 RepID=UPI0004417AB8|nr:uncharacterized protein PUNSTDRAFT_144300 [Punctularia strigosozonata HHB-11173 SS5]EIN07751.1 hypothetical protein PUNSTDRAFT_144300 [Punctularia strigosozonata HHB-11173 SS5]